jgi:D-alanine--poly(phosphoribitol) ligase subunit 1
MSFSLLERLISNFKNFSDRNAFYIGDHYYTYAQFEQEIAKIQHSVISKIPHEEKVVAIVTHDDIQTYASIIALWFTGKAFVPLNPLNPNSRNHNIIRQTDINSMISSKEIKSDFRSELDGIRIFSSIEKTNDALELVYVESSEEDDCYVLFTSGSTGKPKGVPISRKNLNSYVNSYFNAGYEINEEDRFLQIYDLSFDGSIPCYIIPLAIGACVFTVPQDQIKYLYAYKLMLEKQLTFVKMPPSTLAYLQPYFKDISLKDLRYCLFGGEAFSTNFAQQWASCAPNAQIQNIYGPTEATINSHIYNWNLADNEAKSTNGIVSIGKCFGDSDAMVVNAELEPLNENEKGELCLCGDQLTRGYWRDEERTRDAFFKSEYQGKIRTFYRTGDLVFRDTDGDYMYIGRLDSQIQIQGYRVELGEIEKHVRDFLNSSNVAVLARLNTKAVMELYLFIENAEGMQDDIKYYLEQKVPPYMLPKRIINMAVFPKSAGGKIHRTALENILENESA